MAIKKHEKGKVVIDSVLGTFFSVRIIPEYTGYDKKRKLTTSSYALCNKKKIVKDGFPNSDLAINFCSLIIDSYNPKENTYGAEPSEEKWNPKFNRKK